MREISREILKHRRFLITTHVEPDGDAVGSALSMYHALRARGKEAVICIADSVPDVYCFLPGARDILREVPSEFKADALVVLDCSELNRAGEIVSQAWAPSMTVFNIDHHSSNNYFGNYHFVEEGAATAELVYEMIQDLNVSVSHTIGMCIYTAILTDTGGFRYRNTTRRSLQIAAEIVGCGVNPGDIAERVCESYPMERFQILGKALRNLRVSCQGKVADFFVSRAMLNGNGVSPSIVEGFVNYPREINGVLVSIFFREKGDGQYRVSLRSKGNADVSLVAQAFGGGGHRNAAGCRVDGNFDTVRERVLRKVCEMIQGCGR